MPKTQRGLPKMPKWKRDNNPLLAPSLTQIIVREEAIEAKLKKEKNNALKSKKRKHCEDCMFWKGDHCGLWSSICVSSPLRPRFLPKED